MCVCVCVYVRACVRAWVRACVYPRVYPRVPTLTPDASVCPSAASQRCNKHFATLSLLGHLLLIQFLGEETPNHIAVQIAMSAAKFWGRAALVTYIKINLLVLVPPHNASLARHSCGAPCVPVMHAQGLCVEELF